MQNYLNKEQTVVVSGFLSQNGKILLVRSVSMMEQLNDTEYYDIPSWEVPFGIDPQEKIEGALKKLLGARDFIEIYPMSTYSFLQDDGASHTIGIVYKVNAPEKLCESVKNCEDIRFVDIEDIDAYIFSDRIKDMIRKGL